MAFCWPWTLWSNSLSCYASSIIVLASLDRELDFQGASIICVCFLTKAMRKPVKNSILNWKIYLLFFLLLALVYLFPISVTEHCVAQASHSIWKLRNSGWEKHLLELMKNTVYCLFMRHLQITGYENLLWQNLGDNSNVSFSGEYSIL